MSLRAGAQDREASRSDADDAEPDGTEGSNSLNASATHR
jgi:hypothetical protein